MSIECLLRDFNGVTFYDQSSGINLRLADTAIRWPPAGRMAQLTDLGFHLDDRSQQNQQSEGGVFSEIGGETPAQDPASRSGQALRRCAVPD